MEFQTSKEAVSWFIAQLAARQITVTRRERWKVYAGGNRWAYPEVLFTDSNEAFFFKYWKKAFLPDSTKDIRMPHIRALDERIKYGVHAFGNGNQTTTFLNESTVLRLMELSVTGVAGYLVVAFGNGTALWCSIVDFYAFAVRYGMYLTSSRLRQDMIGELPYHVPTGWLRPFGTLVAAPPAVLL